MIRLATACLVVAVMSVSCTSNLPVRPAPIARWEEPAEWMRTPEDEAQRLQLAAGTFSGVRVRTTRASLDEEPQPGLEVIAVVENSPAAAAGLEVGDLLLRASVSGASKELDAPSDWRAVELDAQPGTTVELWVERAAKAMRTQLVLVARLAPAEREEVARFREEERVGAILRSATEVEARAAGLAPGAGVVLVGLAASSPWRGLPDAPRFGDVIVAVDSVPMDDPARFLSVVRSAKVDRPVQVEYLRGTERQQCQLPLSKRATELKSWSIPLLAKWKRDTERTEFSALLGLIHYETTVAAWSLTLLWLIDFNGGDADRLQEVE